MAFEVSFLRKRRRGKNPAELCSAGSQPQQSALNIHAFLVHSSKADEHKQKQQEGPPLMQVCLFLIASCLTLLSLTLGRLVQWAREEKTRLSDKAIAGMVSLSIFSDNDCIDNVLNRIWKQHFVLANCLFPSCHHRCRSPKSCLDSQSMFVNATYKELPKPENLALILPLVHEKVIYSSSV